LANPERALGDESRREAIPGRSHAFIEYPRRRRALETSSGVEWGDVVLAMRQELALAPGIEKQLDAADGRLAALLEIAPLPAYFSAPGASRAPLTRAPAIPVAPPFWESTGVVSRERRRFGPAGRMDPEWTIAPLTRSERKAADPYYRDVIAGGEQPALTSAWVPEARQALVTAVSIYDGRVRAVRRSQSTLDAVRLPVFLALWAANDGDEVAVHRVGLPRPQRHSRSL
jgi:hypothetical protein